ncbi:hypothetical protein KSF_086040 [Reticulibacter mediterranei]|uniref:Uncharacterized protein n=1 Tax=Reticulibacter mediterranei TaxID=2778369 RepID=A0A8J3J0E5_9CHLR|nr:hypothetical protein KSF_086040 [Reticulibacter mediterranei]
MQDLGKVPAISHDNDEQAKREQENSKTWDSSISPKEQAKHTADQHQVKEGRGAAHNLGEDACLPVQNIWTQDNIPTHGSEGGYNHEAIEGDP